MGGHEYIYLACQCGHEVHGAVALMPALLNAKGEVRLDALDRLRCLACGRVGRPKTVRLGWSIWGDLRPPR